MQKVTVVIPVYNGEKTITKAINSVLSQNITVEIIVVNDNSNDETSVVLEEFPQINVVNNINNLGAAESRNIGVSMAKTPYVAFLDADDYWEKDKLIKQLRFLERTDADLVCTARKIDFLNREKLIPVDETLTFNKLLKGNQIVTSSVLVKTDIMKAYPMQYEESHEDYITWLKMLQDGVIIKGLNEALVVYRVDKNSKSGNKVESAKMTWQVYSYFNLSLFDKMYNFSQYAVRGICNYFIP